MLAATVLATTVLTYLLSCLLLCVSLRTYLLPLLALTNLNQLLLLGARGANFVLGKINKLKRTEE